MIEKEIYPAPALPGTRSRGRRLLSFLRTLPRFAPRLKMEAVGLLLFLATMGMLLFQDLLLDRSLVFDESSASAYIHYPYSDAQVGGASTALVDRAHPMSWSCEVRQGAPYPYCGFEFLFDPERGERGLDLTDFDSVSLRLSYVGPAETLRLDLKNFDPRYSVPARGETSKFNTAEFATSAAPQTVHISLKGFTVADWWLLQQRIPPEFRSPQFDNITSLAIQTGSDADLGTHRFRVHSIRFEGAALNHAELYFGLMALWVLFAGAFLIQRLTELKRDIAEREAAEARTELLQNQLIHVSRVSAMGEMASALAHELNQPLSSVATYMGGIRRLVGSEKPEARDRALAALASAEEAALRAGDIIRRLRELVSGRVQRSDEDLVELVRQVGTIAFVDAEILGVRRDIHIAPQCRRVEVDKVQIQQVLLNLIRNAIQAMEGQPVRRLSITSHCADNGMVEVRVSDTGPGIPPKMREELFTAFRTDKPGGMGIGLSISRTIVEAHGGNIWVEDGAEGGTVFTFTLPTITDRSAGSGKPQPFRN